jgi:glycosyltransferase involved in cell wall biosynthesis
MIKTGIITVTYNVSKLLTYQVECFKKYCTDDYELIVIDNSNDVDEIYEIKNICYDNGIRYVGTYISVNSGNIPSTNHGLALNYAHKEFKSEFDYLFFIDHDLFPVKKFSVKEILGKKIISGCENVISNTKYLWPGCLMIKKLEESFDFTPVGPLDTGGRLSNFIKENENKVLYLNNKKVDINTNFNDKYMHNFYWDIHDGTFIHFINASNWSNSESTVFCSRLTHLFKSLDGIITKEESYEENFNFRFHN